MRYLIPATDATETRHEFDTADHRAPEVFAREVAPRLSADQVQAVIRDAISYRARIDEEAHIAVHPISGEVIHATDAVAWRHRANEPVTEGDDPRLAEFWDKAQRYAESAGFCSEFDRIAEALGGPGRRVSWSGYQQFAVTLTVAVPIAGECTATEWENGTMDVDTPDDYEVADALLAHIDEMTPARLRYDIDTEPGDIDPDTLTAE
jgi:hypothetical protein